jgi:hypothetical protein
MSDTPELARPELARTVRGKRPEFFATEGVDEVMSMVLVLAQELHVVRERLDTAERVMSRHGIDLAAEIEALQPDEALLRTREQALQDFYGRLFQFSRQQRSELEHKYSDRTYRETLDKVATGDI